MSSVALGRLLAAADKLLISEGSDRFPSRLHPQPSAFMDKLAVFARVVEDAKVSHAKMKSAKYRHSDHIIASLEMELAKANNKLNGKEGETA